MSQCVITALTERRRLATMTPAAETVRHKASKIILSVGGVRKSEMQRND